MSKINVDRKNFKFTNEFGGNSNNGRFSNFNDVNFLEERNSVNFVFVDSGLAQVKGQIFKKLLSDDSEENNRQVVYGDFPGLESKNRLSFIKNEFANSLFDIETINENLDIDTAIITVKGSKNIITTNYEDRKGTFKEFVNYHDYIINIEGLITNKNLKNIYPEAEVLKLIKYCNLPFALKIENYYLNNFFGIKEITINNFKLNQRVAKQNTQAFRITAFADDFTAKRKDLRWYTSE